MLRLAAPLPHHPEEEGVEIGEAEVTEEEEAKANLFKLDADDSAPILAHREAALSSPLGTCLGTITRNTQTPRTGGMKTIMNIGIQTTPPTIRSRETIPGEGTRQSLSPVSTYLPKPTDLHDIFR